MYEAFFEKSIFFQWPDSGPEYFFFTTDAGQIIFFLDKNQGQNILFQKKSHLPLSLCHQILSRHFSCRCYNHIIFCRKYKSRMEAINEIIARSQSQAQAMLSTANYLDESYKSLASPRVTFDTSPDNSICSDMSFNSTIAVIPEPAKNMKSTPRKS